MPTADSDNGASSSVCFEQDTVVLNPPPQACDEVFAANSQKSHGKGVPRPNVSENLRLTTLVGTKSRRLERSTTKRPQKVRSIKFPSRDVLLIGLNGAQRILT